MTRSTHGIHEGSMYFEITVNKSTPIKIDGKSTSPHVRVGWSLKEGDIQAPVGYDRYSYSYRDVNGAKFHESNGQTYGEEWGTNKFNINLLISLLKYYLFIYCVLINCIFVRCW